MDAGETVHVTRNLRGVRACDQHLVRQQRAGADVGVLQRLEPGLGVALLGDRVEVGLAQLDVPGGDHQGGHDGEGDAGREPAMAHDQLGPARPCPARLVVGAPVRPVEPPPPFRQHDR